MKKLLKFIFYFILFILVVLIIAPVLFKGKIITIVKEQINSNVNAQADFKDLSLSFFKSFPHLNVGIKDLSVVGIDNFEEDTLLYLKSFDVAVDVISAIKMNNIKVKKISIDHPLINGIILEDGSANWDIAKESSDTDVEEVDTTSSEFNTTIALKLFSITNASIFYTDNKSDMKASLENLNFTLKGDLSQNYSDIVINSNTEKLNFIMSGIKYLKDVALNIHIDLGADLDKMIFTMKENTFSLNDFILTLDGKVEMPDSSDMSIDMSYKTNQASFKSLLSLVPAIYMRDFTELKAAGKIGLDGKISGTVGDETTPDIDGKLIVSNAMFSYPDLPKNADNINIDIDYHYDGRQMDNTTVDINKFHVEFAGNPIDLVLNLKTPISDPFINGQLIADIDLASFSDVIPLDDTKIKGLIKSDIDMMGNLSLIENEQYENFKAQGNLNISDFYFNSPDMPKPVGIEIANIDYSPKFVDIKSFKASMGKSDFALSGKVTNFLPFVLNDGTVKGELNFSSKTTDLNELIVSTEEETVVETEDTTSIDVIEVPANIDFRLNSSISNLYYDKMEMKNVNGVIYIKDGRVVMDELSMNVFQGSLIVSGEYSSQDIKNPLVDFKFQAKGIDIAETYSGLDVLGEIAPIASKAVGKVSIGMEYSSFLTSKMNPVLKSIVGAGNMTSDQIGLDGSNAFNAIGENLNLDAFKEMILKDIDIDYEIIAGKLLVNPFDANMGSGNLTVSGEQGFDNIMDYDINLSVPKSLFGTANSKLNSIYEANPVKGFDIKQSDVVNLAVNLSGKMSDPKVKIKPFATTQSVKEDLKANAQEAIDVKKEEAKAQARAEADKIIADAEKQAEELRKQAKIAADKVRQEANASADKMVKEAKNPLLKKAAEVTAKDVRKKGEENATKIETEADSKAKKIVSEAQNKADKLLN